MEEESLTVEASKPLSDLRDLIGKRIGIELINGSKYNGILKSFDVYMNVVLDDCEVNDVKGNITKHNVVFVRASYGILKLTF
ncbi:hypothetical protein J4436_00695 [Candidatus Woesearchaeota archaeon]|nr:hypothetical protein [Candidatus Woesearchaeota archaeon]